MPDNAQHKIDAYLGKLRQGLRGMNDSDVNEVVMELRSHILERAGSTEAGVDAALASLGLPEALAKEYLVDDLLARTESTRSPATILHALFRWATLSFAGFWAFLASLAGYSFGLLCILCALVKPLHPGTAGLWSFFDATGDTSISLRLGFVSPPQNAHELLGWWIVPIGLGVGFILLLLTTSFARWFIRQLRRSQSVPRPS